MTPFVLPLDSTEATLAKVGGKGANLSSLIRAGFPVPPGFLITTDAYHAFVQANNLEKQITALARDNSKTSEEVSLAIRALFEPGYIPPEITTAIYPAYADLMRLSGENVPVVVRSSATAEDLPGTSFAGQQESYLNIQGEEALFEAIQKCWSSLWTARALDYRTRQNVDPSSISLAVVVQTMVPADAAGILFTANPLSGARDEIVIDAAWGLGEAIVGGLVTPDDIVADKTTGAIKQMTIGDKAVMTVPTATGTEEREVEASKRRAKVLNAAQVAVLVKLGAAFENYYDSPQDIEWCLVDGDFFIVQARPITTLPPEPVNWNSPVPGAKWIKDVQASEWATEPVSPLGATTTFEAMVAARQRQLPMQRSPWSVPINGWLFMRADFQPLWLPVALMKLVLGIPAGMTFNGRQRMQRAWPKQLKILDSLERTELEKLSEAGLQAHADHLLEALGWWWWEVTWYAAAALLGEQIIRKLEVHHLADPAVLFRGNDSLLLEAERALRLAAKTGEVEAYLERFGHFVESADPIHPTVRESRNLLHLYLEVARHSKLGPDERLSSMRSERIEAEKIVRALRGPRGFLARRILDIGQSFAAYVDDSVFHFQRVLALVRATFLEAGQRLVRKGALEKAEDIFYLERGEVWALPADLMEHVTKRRQQRDRHKRIAPPPFIPPLSDPSWDSDLHWKFFSSALGATVLKRGVQDSDRGQVLVGTPGSPGRAQGIARVIRGPDDFNRFQPGDVLIAHTTTPIWTPLFNIASAAVTEVGGPFSHAAIVAREFGIPLVNGALDAAQVIEDGMSVVVDGSAGVVELFAR